MTREENQKRGRLAWATCVAAAVASVAGAAWAQESPQGAATAREVGSRDSNDATLRPSLQAGPASEAVLADLLAEELRLAQQWVKAFPDNEQPLVLLGSIHSRGGQVDQAFACWEKAVQMNPKRADVVDRMASLALQTDQVDRAISLWRKVLEIDPGAPEVHARMAGALMRQGKDQEAIAAIRQEAKISGDRAQDYFALGQAYQHIEDYEKAKENYLRVITLQGDHMNAFYGLYAVCSRLKQPEEAKRHLDRFQKLKDRQKETLRKADEKMMTDVDIFYQNLATFFFDAATFGRTQGTSPEVAEVLKKAFLLGEGSSVFLSRLAGYYSGADRVTEALSLYLKAAQIAPKDASCPLNTGILLVRMGRAEKAEPFFRKAIELSPDHYAGYQELARLYLRMNSHLAEALQLATKAVELDARADTYYDLGAARLMNGDGNGAWTEVNKAVELDPDNAEYRQLLDVIKKKGGGK